MRESQREGFVVLELAGRLETKTAHAFEQKVIEHLSAGARQFVIDFKEVEFVSSAGLRVLLMLAKKIGVREGTGALALSSVNDAVKQVLDVSGFASFFTLAASPEAAIQEASRRASSPRILEQAARVLGVRKPPAAGSGGKAPDSEILNRAASILRSGPDQKPKKR
ncbi:MAG: STAS domain-containing protein [Acidobacteria bacterium]|nr:STAS domain-containing protein [Acidobacteriota bacterium]MCA1617239.1 STAS domain-containing protein [Acidobacteriota bacterium]